MASAEDIEQHKAEFVASYNKLQGLQTLKTFQGGNCCVAVKGGNKLVISESVYGFQFPAATNGEVRCNPTGGYSDAKYQFYKLPTLALTQTFSSKPGCSTSHNPAVYIRLPDVKDLEFGFYDLQQDPGGNWKVMDIVDFNTHRSDFIAHYNSNSGVNTIKPFNGGNCCIAVKGGQKLTISGSKVRNTSVCCGRVIKMCDAVVFLSPHPYFFPIMPCFAVRVSVPRCSIRRHSLQPHERLCRQQVSVLPPC